MTVEQRMQEHLQSSFAPARGMHGMQNPYLKDRFHKPRTVFTPGHRIRMNVVPMFVNVFVPWAFFLFIAGVSSFSLIYTRPKLAAFLIGLCVMVVAALSGVALWFRKRDPEPTWFTYFAMMMLLALVFGLLFGSTNYHANMHQFYEIQDMKVVNRIDAGREHGQNVMDAGVFFFAPGNQLDVDRTWHFMHRSLYCVAPIVGAGAPTPETLSYDFWAVGKDCCSMAASDFRCGDAAMPRSRSAIRVFDDDDMMYYRLAVEQASSLYNIQARNPIFFEWKEDPMEAVNAWNEKGYRYYVEAVAFFFVVCVFCMAMAVCQFSWIGRRSSPYEASIMEDPLWFRDGQGMYGMSGGMTAGGSFAP